jgi:hypothetical protein
VDITSVDSITRLPLAGASVRLVSVVDTTRVHDATLDASGRARVDSLPAGPWMLTARHARLDTLGVGSVAVPFTVRSGRGVTVRAAVPSVGTLVARVCGSAATPGTGYLFGTVRRAVRTSASPRAAATFLHRSSTTATRKICAPSLRRVSTASGVPLRLRRQSVRISALLHSCRRWSAPLRAQPA